jgi:arylsulfatase A-like enzyme
VDVAERLLGAIGLQRAVGVAIMLLLAGCGAPTQPVRAPNLIVVSIDTLRADRLGSYGYPRPTSPHIDALAARGVRFEHVIAETSWTLPAHMTLFTGRHPTSHGVTGPADALPSDVPTLAELLAEHGYQSFAETSGGFVHRRFGFDRGFESYADERRDFADVLAAARSHIEQVEGDSPWFVFVHTYDVHCPYGAPEPYAGMFRTRPPEDRVDSEACGANAFAELALRPEQVRDVSDQYDAGIRAADLQLGEFIAFLDSRELLQRTILVLTSDHGEELGEHGRIGHEGTLSVQSLRVPLILLAPGTTPSVVSTGVGLIDVLPTVLELLHVEMPAGVQGLSLAPLLAGSDDLVPRRPLFSELDFRARLRSVVIDGEHLLRDLRTGQHERFDWADDPDELDAKPGDATISALPEALARHLETLPRPASVPTAGPAPGEVEDLRALGYVR